VSMQALEDNVAIMLNQFRVTYRKTALSKGLSVQFIVEDFGLIVCCINRLDYVQVNNAVNEQFDGWRLVFISTNDDMSEKKYEVLWSLMRSGYMKWLRYQLPRQVKSILLGPDNLGNRIIEERLRIWNDKPKFKYLIDDSKVALRNGVLRELTNDPSFFDYMPEEEV
jgi:hypothetical protein